MSVTSCVQGGRTRRALLSFAVAIVTIGVAFGLTAVPSAPARELDDRERRVQRKIDHAEKELRHSSRALARAGRRVERTRGELRRARTQLERRQAEVTAAVVLDSRMQSELEVANARLDRARAALARGERSHEAQQEVLRDIAARTYRDGSPGLMGLTLVLTSADPASLSTQLNVVNNMMEREHATLQRLEASRLLLTLQRERVATARAEVAERRREAARTLRLRRAAEARARVASRHVAERLEDHREARQRAARAKRADQRRLKQLRRERARIVRMIRKREARLRAKRSRAAIARAKRLSRGRGALMQPVGGSITSHYGMRLHPIYRAWRLHDGTDFGASCGTPVRAAAGGRVIGRYYNVGYGHRVIVAHGYMRGAAVTTTYNHLRRYSTHVGQRVRRGEVIGFVGSTGYSTGCHLHFMVFRNGRIVNPLRLL